MLHQLPLHVVGTGEHRSGWPYCVDALRPLFTADATVMFDDFIERTFLYDVQWHVDATHHMPWVGCFHHPPDMPEVYFPQLHLQRLENNARWLSSVEHLRLGVTFAPNTARWLRAQCPDLPIVTVKHPTGKPMLPWSPERFRRNSVKRLVQVGWFLRNTTAIYQVDAPTRFRKTHLRQNQHFVDRAHRLCQQKQKDWYPGRGNVGEVEQLAEMQAVDYDLLLAENVVLVEVISAAANNTVVECIARNTPLCINRHEGPVYYLGEDYPLFFDDLDEVPYLMTEQKILSAHRHLKSMDKWWIRGGMFRAQIQEACHQYVPECGLRQSQHPRTLFSI